MDANAIELVGDRASTDSALVGEHERAEGGLDRLEPFAIEVEESLVRTIGQHGFGGIVIRTW